MFRTLLALSLLLASVIQADADALPPPRIYERVKMVDADGTIFLETHGLVRLWGIMPKREPLAELIEGKMVVCLDLNTIRGRHIISGVMDCYLDVPPGVSAADYDGDLSDILDIAKILIESGGATEVCSETRGYFGTCKGSTTLKN